MTPAAALPDPAWLGMTVPELFKLAMQAHATGEYATARAAYACLREREPGNADGWHLAGVLEGQQGATELGLSFIQRALELDGNQAIFHNNCGNLQARAGRLDEAERCYRQAVSMAPGLFDARTNLGLLLRWRGKFDEAEQAYRAVLQEAPGFSDARQNLVALYVGQGRLRDAMVQAAEGLMTAPRNRTLKRLLGRVYAEFGAPEKAIELYEQWAADEPGDPEPPHYLAALRKEQVPDRASNSYVVSTFETFAASFDAKLAELEYRAPKLVGDCVAQQCGAPAAALDIVDAGCGTGLCAPLLRPFARRLVGVDLSAAMLQRAVERGGYDELLVGELVGYLDAMGSPCDVIVSADTLCYFGRIDGFAEAACRALRPGGLLVFTVEARESAPDFQLHIHGRYSHDRSYVNRALAQAGLREVTLHDVVLRMERGEPVRGFLVHARR